MTAEAKEEEEEEEATGAQAHSVVLWGTEEVAAWLRTAPAVWPHARSQQLLVPVEEAARRCGLSGTTLLEWASTLPPVYHYHGRFASTFCTLSPDVDAARSTSAELSSSQQQQHHHHHHHHHRHHQHRGAEQQEGNTEAQLCPHEEVSQGQQTSNEEQRECAEKESQADKQALEDHEHGEKYEEDVQAQDKEQSESSTYRKGHHTHERHASNSSSSSCTSISSKDENEPALPAAVAVTTTTPPLTKQPDSTSPPSAEMGDAEAVAVIATPLPEETRVHVEEAIQVIASTLHIDLIQHEQAMELLALLLIELLAARKIQRVCRRRARVLTKLHQHRECCAKEILSSEKKYVAQISVLVNVFVQPLRELSPPILSEEEIKAIFSDIIIIKSVNESLLKILHTRIDSWDKDHKIGDVFLRTSDFLRIYTGYVNNYINSAMTLKELDSNHPFWHFFEVQQQKAGNDNLNTDLGSYLILPIQRIPRYQLLLKDLFKHTPKNHPDFKDLADAVEKIGSIASWVNESQHKYQNRMKIVDLQLEVGGLDEANMKLVSASREFIKEGDLFEVVGKKIIKRFVMLFNDLLVLCDHRKRTDSSGLLFKKSSTPSKHQYQYSNSVSFEDMTLTVENLSDSGSCGHDPYFALLA
eukprot:TRINITY_DN1044_c1_g1_i1.p1 TRINITY_DN1044_c1_g1~~TRINITY_DN1044_c1_g1_i1.p1  ORF type:complete len:651 (-),score=196.17 TRINITY_DN1044_c1_g1_i1:37-1959(-)